VKRSLVLALVLVGCGGASHASGTLHADLEALHLDAAAERAPDLVAAARAAEADVRADEARGDVPAAEDDATLARLYGQAAIEEAARLTIEAQRFEAERAEIAAETELNGLVQAATTSAADLARLVAARTAREEGARSLARAEVDEARPARARHDSLDDAGEMRSAAGAIRDRARLLSAAAVALGAAPSTTVDDLIARSSAASTPIEQVRLADAAHAAARAALAAARRARPSVDPARVASLIEAAESEGFHTIRLERGVGIELDGAFDGTTTRLSRTGVGRLARLAALVASYPDGPARVEIDSATNADVTHLAPARGSAVVHALVAGGLDASRVSLADPIPPDGTPSPTARVRVVLSAYVATPPASGGSIPTTSATVSEPAAASGE